MNKRLSAVFLCISIAASGISQSKTKLHTSNSGDLKIQKIQNSQGEAEKLDHDLFSLLIGEELHYSKEFFGDNSRDTVWFRHHSGLAVSVTIDNSSNDIYRAILRFKNTGSDTLEIHNLVPFGESPELVYITGKGRHGLSRTHLFRPEVQPVNVIVPDNAWNLGFCEIESETGSYYGLLRRDKSFNCGIRRFENIIYPGGWVEYKLFVEQFIGDWQEGLRKAFQDRWLFDLDEFDQTLYERQDLEWIRHSYASHLIYTWDHAFYESEVGEYTLDQFLVRGKKLYGGDDFIGIWPTWPTLGLDQRNQWDLFRDLPGGLVKINALAKICRNAGSKFFICYNPWDSDTRSESHYTGMAEMIKEIGADGVVLDTKGSSSLELQHAADSVRSGVVMYSEGMAVPKDMPGIVSGRVHNALYYPPMLNLNKLIKPDFAIFRVAELAFEPIRREYATSFFNGYGTELNIFKPGRPEWVEDDYKFFGRTLRILRENTSCFVGYNFTPLIPTLTDNIWVNKWPSERKTIYTVFSLIPEGFDDILFEAEVKEGYHWVDLWNHQELTPVEKDGKLFVQVRTESFHKSWLGTNNEGAVSGIGHFKERLFFTSFMDEIHLDIQPGEHLKIWSGDPDYSKTPLELGPGRHRVSLFEEFRRAEGDFVLQLFENEELVDEKLYYLKPGTPRLLSQVGKTEPGVGEVANMCLIPAGVFEWKTTHGDEFIGYPENPYKGPIQMHSFYMDKHPVTNQEYYEFIRQTGYYPEDPANFLKHWKNGIPLKSDRQKPVTYVSYEDANAYAKWSGKRLPSELEWQYAAQSDELWPWPWSKLDTIKRETEYVTNTLTVSRLKGVGTYYCNPGNGILDPIGKYPMGDNRFGISDLVGTVWQLTNDLYDNGSYNFIILKGGSYFNPGSSWWYVQGGPRPLHYRQMLLRVSRGFERNSTVGFRCVKDAR